MSIRRNVVVACFTLAVCVCGAKAQPRGPRDVITGARKALAEKELRKGIDATAPATRPASPTRASSPAASKPMPQADSDPESGQGLAANPHAGSPHNNGVPARRKPLAEGRENAALPAGAVQVRVVDSLERPLPNLAFRIGVLKSDGSRDSTHHKTDAQGMALVAGLPVGDKQAYRVQVKADGASFGSSPFRLPHGHGYEVTIRRLPTTTSQDELVLYVGAVSVELKEDRIKVAQQMRLINVGQRVFVFPADGQAVSLPDGFTAFQAQESMGDQRVIGTDTGLKFEGSIPPGQVTMLWGFDLPIDGTEMDFTLANPFKTYANRVLADAAPGLTLSVDGLPEAELHDAEGGRYWLTEAARKVEQGPLHALHIHLRGIPGPGPGRWIATGLALLVLGIGYMLARRSVVPQDRARAVMLGKDAILNQIRELQQEHKDGDIGPEYFESETSRLTDALATLLWEQGQLTAPENRSS